MSMGKELMNVKKVRKAVKEEFIIKV